MKALENLTKEELISINGGEDNTGSKGTIWDLLGFLFTFHAREVMYSDNAPSTLAYK
jgi:hypothetical protein